MIKHGLLSLGLLLTGAVMADVPEDYAYGAELKTEGRAAVYELSIPAQALQQSLYSDNRDLRVFNAAGQAVATTRIAEQEPALSERLEALTVYPLYRDRQSGAGSLSLSLNKDNHQIVVQRAIALRKRINEGYLFDRGGSDTSIDLLRIEIDTQTPGIAHVEVLTSADMHQWHQAGRGSLVSLKHVGQHLQRGEIELRPTAHRFIKLQWRDPGTEMTLTAARARVLRQSPVAETLRLSIEAERVGGGGSYLFSLPHGAAVTALDVQLPESNTVVTAQLWWRKDSRQEWRMTGRHSLYRIDQQGAQFRSDPLPITTSHRGGEWRLTLADVDAVGDQSVQLFALATPQRLLFLSRGEAPYQLVWGRAGMAPQSSVDLSLSKLLEAGIKPTAVDAIQQPRALAGEAARQAGMQWPQWVLWCVIAAAVLLLASMAVKLLRQIDSGKID